MTIPPSIQWAAVGLAAACELVAWVTAVLAKRYAPRAHRK
jgi:hypothetical protein